MSGVLLAIVLAGAASTYDGDKADVVKSISDPECPGGTTLQTQERGTDFVKFCARGDGKREGPFVNIDTSKGIVAEKGEYHAGKLHGGWSKWDAAGTLRSQGDYKEGDKIGWWVTFHPNGKKETAGEYGGDGRKRGIWTKWDADGKVLEEGEYRAGNKHGIWITYDPRTGKVKTQTEYADGKERKR